MHMPKFLLSLYHATSPSHRKAARERRNDYDAHFDEHKDANLKRIRRISHLRGDENNSAFLYDSAHGSGASNRNSIHETRLRELGSTHSIDGAGRTQARRPVSMIYDYEYNTATSIAPPVPMLPPTSMHTTVSPTYGNDLAASNASLRTTDGLSSAPSLTDSSNLSSRSVSRQSGAWEYGSTRYDDPPSYLASARRRPRPLSMPGAPSGRHVTFGRDGE